MIGPRAGTRVWLAAGITDMRCGIDSLSVKVQTVLYEDPYAGHVFAFRGRRGDLVKLLWSDGDGMCLLTKRLERGTFTALAAQMLEHIEQQARDLERQQTLLQRKDRDIAWRDAKIEKITFELTRLKRWKFGAKSEAMTADQRQMFQDTLLEDEADLEAQLAALQAALPKTPAKAKEAPRRPRRQALPDHLRRVEHQFG